MCFYDAELLRQRAHTHTDPDARHVDLSAAVTLARQQGAYLPGYAHGLATVANECTDSTSPLGEVQITVPSGILGRYRLEPAHRQARSSARISVISEFRRSARSTPLADIARPDLAQPGTLG